MIATIIDAIITILIAIGIMGAVFGYPIYRLLKYLRKTRTVFRFPFKEPTIFTNVFGHLIRIDPDPEMYASVQDYFNYRPNVKRRFLKNLK